MAGRRTRAAPRRRTAAAVGHALAYTTWQSLTQHNPAQRQRSSDPYDATCSRSPPQDKLKLPRKPWCAPAALSTELRGPASITVSPSIGRSDLQPRTAPGAGAPVRDLCQSRQVVVELERERARPEAAASSARPGRSVCRSRPLPRATAASMANPPPLRRLRGGEPLLPGSRAPGRWTNGVCRGTLGARCRRPRLERSRPTALQTPGRRAEHAGSIAPSSPCTGLLGRPAPRVRPGGEEQRVRRAGEAVVAECERPEPADRDRPMLRFCRSPSNTQPSLRPAVRADHAVAEVADQQVAAVAAERLRRTHEPPRLVQPRAREARDELPVRCELVDVAAGRRVVAVHGSAPRVRDEDVAADRATPNGAYHAGIDGSVNAPRASDPPPPRVEYHDACRCGSP